MADIVLMPPGAGREGGELILSSSEFFLWKWVLFVSSLYCNETNSRQHNSSLFCCSMVILSRSQCFASPPYKLAKKEMKRCWVLWRSAAHSSIGSKREKQLTSRAIGKFVRIVWIQMPFNLMQQANFKKAIHVKYAFMFLNQMTLNLQRVRNNKYCQDLRLPQ